MTLQLTPAATSVPESTDITPISECVHSALEAYFRALEGDAPGNLYQLVITEVERSLMDVVLTHTQGNQSKAARLLGINRSTLRKKLIQYDIDTTSE